MRIAACALSAVLLSGCAWLGGSGQAGYGQYGHMGPHAQPMQNGCQGYAVVQPCIPSQFPIQTGDTPYTSFNQQPDFSNYASAGFGSHAMDVATYDATQGQHKRLRKPRLRGSLSLGIEKSYSGDYVNYGKTGGLGLPYNPTDYDEAFSVGSKASGNITDTLYTAKVERFNGPTLSFDDVHTAPATLKGGLEYIMSPKTTIFGNIGYTHSEGKNTGGVEIVGELQKVVTSTDYDTTTLAALGTPVVNASVIPNVPIAHFNYDFSDLRRYDLEVGARHYFNPIITDRTFKTLTPFVSASAGLSHINDAALKVSQDQLFYQDAYDSGGVTQNFYDVVVSPDKVVDLYDAQWLPTASLMGGMEWQVTPKWALAMETGLRLEGNRKYSNGAKGDSNISVPVTLRGSVNF